MRATGQILRNLGLTNQDTPPIEQLYGVPQKKYFGGFCTSSTCINTEKKLCNGKYIKEVIKAVQPSDKKNCSECGFALFWREVTLSEVEKAKRMSAIRNEKQ